MAADRSNKNQPSRNLRIEGIARKSGLSIEMVSAYLDYQVGSAGNIPLPGNFGEFVKKIQIACRELGYEPVDPIWQARIYPETAGLVFLTGSSFGLPDEYFGDMYKALSEIAEEERIHVRLAYFDQNLDYQLEKINLPAETTDGLANKFVIAGRFNRSLADRLLKTGGNLVFLSRASGIPGTVSIVPDYSGAAGQAINMMYAHGHRSIAIAGPYYAIEYGYNVRELIDGALSAASRLGINLNRYDIYFDKEDQASKTPDFLRSILSSPKRYSAIFCLDDLIGSALYKAAAQMKVTIPDDLSIVGCNDTGISRELTPKLSTVHVPLKRMGREVLIQANDMIMNGKPKTAKVVIMPTTPTLRGSIKFV